MSPLTELIIEHWPHTLMFLLVVGRTSALTLAAPFWGSRIIPLVVRFWLAVILAITVYPAATSGVNAMEFTIFTLLSSLAEEALIGLILGWTAQMLFAGIRLGGQQIETKLGLGLIQLFDPNEGGQSGIFAALLELAAGLLFFLLNGHHLLFQALSASYDIFPLGGQRALVRLLEGLVFSAGEIFAIALRVSAPVVVGLFLTDILLGILSRAMPQMNVFLVAQPAQFGFGIFLLLLSLPAMVWFVAKQIPAVFVVPGAGG